MKLQKFKERNNKQKSIIIFTIACILLVTSVFLYKTFSSFQVIENEDLINGDVSDPGDIYFAFYKENKIQKEMPRKSEGYILDEKNSYCGVTGEKETDIKVSLTEDEIIHVSGVTTSRTKCNLYFIKGAYILGKGVPTVTEGNGLYEVTHDGVSGTIKDEGFKQTEYRYAGNDPDNYITFNNETWRIIGLVNVMTSETEVEQRIKIVKNDSIGQYSWDSSEPSVYEGHGVSDWVNADLNELLNDFYYNSLSDQNCYTERNNHTDSCDFSKNGLKTNAKSMIDEIYWNIAAVPTPQQNVRNFYQAERTTTVNENTQYLYKANIGMVSISDYGYATSGISKEQKEECLNHPIRTWKYSDGFNEDSVVEGLEECVSYDWMYHNDNFWTITSHSTWVVYPIYMGIERTGYGWARAPYNVYPSVYLKKDVQISSGTGNRNDSYKVKYAIS